MLNPHAILLTEETIPTIVRYTHADPKNLQEALHDSMVEKRRYVALLYRGYDENLTYMLYNETEFHSEYQIETLKTNLLRVSKRD